MTDQEEIKIKPSYYAIIPASVRYADISANAKLLYGEITALSSKEGYCWASNGYFAELYTVSERAISRWVAELLEHGFITTEVLKDEGNKRKMWIVEATPIDKIVHTSPQNSPDPYRQKRPHINTSSITKSITTSYYSFEQFWNIYPKKVEKKKSEAKWNKLKKEDQAAILIDLPRRIKSESWQKGYILNPMTYLNGERWLDEIPKPVHAFGGYDGEVIERVKREEREKVERQFTSPEGKKKFMDMKNKIFK